MNVAIACGGTGGHIFPGVAVGEALRARGHEVALWLGGRNVEALSTSAWDGPVVHIKAAGFPAGLSLRAVAVGCRLLMSIVACWRQMRRERPDVVVAMGSYASVGPGLAARLLRIPLVLHESNSVPGKAVLLLARYAAVTGLGFDAAKPYFAGYRTVVTGFPLRGELSGAAPLSGLDSNVFTVLVMGGSQGAHAINMTASDALCEAVRGGVALQVIHLSGVADEADVRSRYEAAGVSAQVYGFLADMGAAYAAADLAVCRAGAASCAELTLCRLPAVLVPLPTAAHDHQRANAVGMMMAGGVDMIEQVDLTVLALRQYVEASCLHPERLMRKREALDKMGGGDAAGMMCELIEEAGEQPNNRTIEQPNYER